MERVDQLSHKTFKMLVGVQSFLGVHCLFFCVTIAFIFLCICLSRFSIEYMRTCISIASSIVTIALSRMVSNITSDIDRNGDFFLPPSHGKNSCEYFHYFFHN